MVALTLIPVAGTFAVCKLSPHAPLPLWAASGSFFSITRTTEELSVVCHQDAVPHSVRCERGWRCLRVGGALDLSLVGVLASLVGPLAAASLSVFVLSTFDTDFVLVKEQDYEPAMEVLSQSGHSISNAATGGCAT
jgi:hypothetical protein